VARLRQVLGVANDAQLGRALGLRESAPGNWRARDSVPYRQCVEIAAERGVSLDWLLLGRGPPKPRREDAPPTGVEEPRPVDPDGYAANRQRPPPDDRRLDAVLRWWRTWWGSADEEERTWALVQLRRAIPESAEPIRRLTQEPTADDEDNTGP
jgi:hypothetical protein